ncbi:hypothetical protein KFE25_008140 [Diacronema lutheri]|uniref:Pentatricopeptide repeat-containing protein-mitochondrial domain-containing protein n=2 Tax=Diacronema lutheri TaxID=2081491 RepID=A0A8J6CD50_DIALT|nr:hypothetical protein KFE25_008140 [Diacronema lutheri]
MLSVAARALARARLAPSGLAYRHALARVPAQLHRTFRAAATLCADAGRAPAPEAEPAAAAPEPSAQPAPAAADGSFGQLFNAQLNASNYDEALELFDKQLAADPSVPTIAHWNGMLLAMESAGKTHAEIVDAIGRMRAAGAAPDASSWTHALRACVRGSDPAADLDAGLRIQQSAAADGVQPSEAMLTQLLNLHMRVGDATAARRTMADIAAGEVSRFRASIIYLTSALAHGAVDEFVAHLAEMRANGKQPRAAQMRELLKAAVSRRSVDATMAAMDALLAVGDTFDPMAPLLLLANSGAFDAKPAEAERLLRQSVPLIRPESYFTTDKLHVLSRLLPLLNDPALKMRVIAVIAAKRSLSREVARAIYEMAITGKEESADAAFNVLEAMHARGERVATAAVNAVIMMCAHLKDLDRAVETFQAIEGVFGLEPNTGSYNALLLAATKSKQAEALRQVRERMATAGLAPDRETFRIVAMHLLEAGDEAGALRMLEDAKASGQAGGGLYAYLLKHFLGLPQPGIKQPPNRSSPNLAKVRELRDEAAAHGAKLNDRLNEQIEQALSGEGGTSKPAGRAGASGGGPARGGHESYEEEAGKLTAPRGEATPRAPAASPPPPTTATPE